MTLESIILMRGKTRLEALIERFTLAGAMGIPAPVVELDEAHSVCCKTAGEKAIVCE